MKQMRKLVAIGLAVAMLCVAGLCGCESKGTSGGNEGTVSGKEEPTVGGKEEPKECNHSYSTQIVGATCTERGYTIYTCKLCGDSYKNNYVDALGHSYTEKEVAGTCVQKGYTLHSCTRCGNSYQDNETGYSKHKGVGTCSVCKGNILLLFMGYCVEEGIISTEGIIGSK